MPLTPRPGIDCLCAPAASSLLAASFCSLVAAAAALDAAPAPALVITRPALTSGGCDPARRFSTAFSFGLELSSLAPCNCKRARTASVERALSEDEETLLNSACGFVVEDTGSKGMGSARGRREEDALLRDREGGGWGTWASDSSSGCGGCCARCVGPTLRERGGGAGRGVMPVELGEVEGRGCGS